MAVPPAVQGPLFLEVDGTPLTRDKLDSNLAGTAAGGSTVGQVLGPQFQDWGCHNSGPGRPGDSMVEMLRRWELSAYQRYIGHPETLWQQFQCAWHLKALLYSLASHYALLFCGCFLCEIYIYTRGRWCLMWVGWGIRVLNPTTSRLADGQESTYLSSPLLVGAGCIKVRGVVNGNALIVQCNQGLI